jgi:hypothetical protein
MDEEAAKPKKFRVWKRIPPNLEPDFFYFDEDTVFLNSLLSSGKLKYKDKLREDCEEMNTKQEEGNQDNKISGEDRHSRTFKQFMNKHNQIAVQSEPKPQ